MAIGFGVKFSLIVVRLRLLHSQFLPRPALPRAMWYSIHLARTSNLPISICLSGSHSNNTYIHHIAFAFDLALSITSHITDCPLHNYSYPPCLPTRRHQTTHRLISPTSAASPLLSYCPYRPYIIHSYSATTTYPNTSLITSTIIITIILSLLLCFFAPTCFVPIVSFVQSYINWFIFFSFFSSFATWFFFFYLNTNI